MEQNHLPLSQRLAGDQRRAIGQGRDGALGQRRIGFGHHLRRHRHVPGHREAGMEGVLTVTS